MSDVNRDGHRDVVALSSDGTAAVPLGNGDGTLLAEERIVFSGGGSSVVAADFNGDGLSDVAVNLPSPLIELSSGHGGFRADATSASLAIRLSAATADLDGDGHNDLVMTDGAHPFVSVQMGRGDASCRAAVTFPTPYPRDQVLVGDLDDDGVPDLLVASSVGWFWMRGVGDGGFLPEASTGLPAVAGALGDTNRDETLDFVDDMGAVYLGNGDGTFGQALSTDTYRLATPALVDINGDGNPDLLGLGSDGVLVLMGRGDGTFSTPVAYATNYAGRSIDPTSLVVADFNGDGKVDVIVSNRLVSVGLLLGNGDGTFGRVTNYPSLCESYPPVASGDFNGDGRPDIAVPESTGIGVLLNRGCY
jgi:hypothetical protein